MGNTVKNNNGKIKEYDILRVLVTFFVIISHCGYIYISTDYGGCDYNEYAENLSLVYKLFRFVVAALYSFHMPLFMALSGALYYRSSQNPKYDSFGYLFSAKFKRLIIPFLVVTCLYSFPLKYASGYFSESENVWKDFGIGQLLLQGNSHLWYVAALFFIFIFVYWCEKIIKDKSVLKLIIFFVLFMLSKRISIQIISYIFNYSLWFYCGFMFEPIRTRFNKLVNLRNTIISVFVFGAAFIVNMKFMKKIEYISDLYSVIVALCGMVMTYNICYVLSGTNITDTKLFNFFARDSFGMYLYSDPLNYVILAIGVSAFGSSLFSDNLGSVAIIGSRFIITTLSSLVVTELLRKLKLKYLV